MGAGVSGVHPRGKFKAVCWPWGACKEHRGRNVDPRHFYVVEIDARDGSYYPHEGPWSRTAAEAEAKRRQEEWERASMEGGLSDESDSCGKER